MDKQLNIAKDKLSEIQKEIVKKYLNKIIKQIVEIDDTDIIADWIFTLIIDQNYNKKDTKETLVQTLGDEAQSNRLCVDIYEKFLQTDGRGLPLLPVAQPSQPQPSTNNYVDSFDLDAADIPAAPTPGRHENSKKAAKNNNASQQSSIGGKKLSPKKQIQRIENSGKRIVRNTTGNDGKQLDIQQRNIKEPSQIVTNNNINKREQKRVQKREEKVIRLEKDKEPAAHEEINLRKYSNHDGGHREIIKVQKNKQNGDVFDRLNKKKPMQSSESASDQSHQRDSSNKDHLKMGLNELIQRDHEERRKEINEKFYGGPGSGQHQSLQLQKKQQNEYHSQPQEIEKRIVKAADNKKKELKIIPRKSLDDQKLSNQNQKGNLGILLKKRDYNGGKGPGSGPSNQQHPQQQIQPSEAQKQKMNNHINNKQINLKELKINNVINKGPNNNQGSSNGYGGDSNNNISHPQNKENYKFLSSEDVRLKRMQRFQQNQNGNSPSDQDKKVIITRNADGQKRIDLQKPSNNKYSDTKAHSNNHGVTAGNQQPSENSKKQIRCKHFPHCINKVDCPFVHPTENCKYFPACSQGEKCLYLHPEIDCKFGLKCTRQNCAYTHPKGRVVGKQGYTAGVNGANNIQQMQIMQMMMLMAQTQQSSYSMRRPNSHYHSSKPKPPYQGSTHHLNNNQASSIEQVQTAQATVTQVVSNEQASNNLQKVAASGVPTAPRKAATADVVNR